MNLIVTIRELEMPRKTAPLPPTLEDILKTLGENIKLARLRRKITTVMLAERAGMNRVTLPRIRYPHPRRRQTRDAMEDHRRGPWSQAF